MTSTRKILTLVVILAAIGLLYPGISQPILTLTGTIEKSEIAELGINMIAGEGADSQSRQMLGMFSSLLGLDQIEGELQVYSTTRSILGTVDQLANTGNLLVAFLIVFFSLVIPVFKLLLLLVTLAVSGTVAQGFLLKVNSMLSKWSMADVFVMALLVAFMAGSASGQSGEILAMEANLEVGFYYFLAYCLFSIAAGSLLLGSQKSSSSL
ncbi:MAG: paraquat-inducible protein A [Halioglobus sp.]